MLPQLFLLKLAAALAILLVAAVGVRWAVHFSGKKSIGKRQGWANALAAGIFLGTGLLHFGANAHRGWIARGSDYPWASLLILGAFLVLLFVEHVAFSDAAHTVAHSHTGGHGHHHHEISGQPSAGGRGTFGILLALSLHSLLAGLALGIAHDSATTTLTAAAILAHKLTEGFALGTVLSHTATRSWLHPSAWLFVLATPLGILVGTVAQRSLSNPTGSTLDLIVTSFAAGTFLYIGAFDLLQDEFIEPEGRVAKWMFAALGVGLTALLATVS